MDAATLQLVAGFAAAILTMLLWIMSRLSERLGRLEASVAELRERMARVEAKLEYLAASLDPNGRRKES